MSTSSFDLSGDVLEQLLRPLTTQEFLDNYFGIQPLYIPGHPEKFTGLFSRRRFLHAVNNIPASPQHTPALRGAIGRGATFPIHKDQVQHILRAGGTICVSSIHHHDQRLATMVNQIRARLNFAGTMGLHCYYSSQQCGFTTHFDARIATTLQIAGRKRWRYGATPALPYPRQNATLGNAHVRHLRRSSLDLAAWERVSPPDDSTFEEVLVSPGDVLCLPAGTWHEAQALDDESLALNLFFDQLDLSSVLSVLIDEELAGDPGWRKGVAPSLDQSREESTPPQMVLSELAAQLDTLAGVLSRIKDDPAKLTHAWNRVIALQAWDNDSPAERPPAPSESITTEDRFVATKPARLRYTTRQTAHGHAVLDVYFGAFHLELPIECRPLLVQIKQGATFRVRDILETDATPELALTTLQTALQDLVCAGVLSRWTSQGADDFWAG